MDIKISCADHRTLLKNPLATIIDLTAKPLDEIYYDLLLPWEKEHSKTPLHIRVEQELARIDPLLELVARNALGTEPDLLRDAFRYNSYHNRNLQFMGLILIPLTQEHCEYSAFIDPSLQDYTTVFSKKSYISFPPELCGENFRLLREETAEFIWLMNHEFIHNAVECRIEYKGRPGGELLSLIQQPDLLDEKTLRAAILTGIMANPEFHDHMLQRCQKLLGDINSLENPRARKMLTDFISLNAGYAIAPEKLPCSSPPVTDRPWDLNSDDPGYKSLDDFRQMLLEVGHAMKFGDNGATPIAESIQQSNYRRPKKLTPLPLAGDRRNCAWRRLAGPAP